MVRKFSRRGKKVSVKIPKRYIDLEKSHKKNIAFEKYIEKLKTQWAWNILNIIIDQLEKSNFFDPITFRDYIVSSFLYELDDNNFFTKKAFQLFDEKKLYFVSPAKYKDELLIEYRHFSIWHTINKELNFLVDKGDWFEKINRKFVIGYIIYTLVKNDIAILR